MRAINCRTKEEFKKVLDDYEEKGRVSACNEKPTDCVDNWDDYGKETCIEDRDGFRYSPVSFYKKEGHTIIPASEYLGEWKQGDILVDEDGDKRKIMGVCGELYLVSWVNDFESYADGYTKKKLEENSYKKEGEESEEVDVTVEGKTTRISRKSAKALGLIK